MAADDIYQLSVVGSFGGQEVVNVYYCQQVGSDGTGDARQAVANAFNLILWPEIQKNLVTDYVHVAYKIRGLGANETQTFISPTVEAGTVIAEGLPANSVLMIRNYATQIGSRGTGRTLFSGISEDAVQSGNIKALALAGWSDYIDALIDDVGDSGTGYVFRFGIWNPDLAAPINIVRAEVQPRMRTLRSRTPGQGD